MTSAVAEPTRLARYQQRTEWWLALIALAFLALYSVDVLARPSPALDTWLDSAMVVIWVCFGVDFLIRLSLASPRLRWLLWHLPEAVILMLPVLRPLRLLSLAVVIGVLQRAIGHTIRGRVIVFTACGTVLLVYSAALVMLDAERDHNENINNFGDALWWSFTTVTTVGYGDTVPVTVVGRLIAVALMVAGVSLLAVVTATLASWIVERVAAEDTASQVATAAQIEELRAEVRKLGETLNAPAYGEPTGRGVDAKEVT
ncbi:potassium channel family protein [Mycolicibacterium arenosum]|uniref:Potassium channel family protein n=1 Tax=Mycolicibacterium arenosum TaxID=2952157 RepID=A0ABT1MBT6_9MYCO|nr:potassium channel family protein [Mycolicibacterium sp. CAU 1645]MCP9276613.1 potassium channel family protein [Mycolicibacterium sp. CAU 1645]